MKDNISPEEKLLKLIKGEKKSTPSYLSAQDIATDKKITANISNIKPGIKDSLQCFTDRYLTILCSRKLMTALIAMSFIYLGISFIYPWLGLEKIRLPDMPAEKIKTEEPASELKDKPKPYEFYSQALGQRQIFSSQSTPESVGAQAVASADLIKDINLVGIISGENPQAVIEDKATHKTYYLSKGQSIGELQIEDIQEGKIILNYNGQRYELYL